jgi:hypothetical protein
MSSSRRFIFDHLLLLSRVIAVLSAVSDLAVRAAISYVSAMSYATVSHFLLILTVNFLNLSQISI